MINNINSRNFVNYLMVFLILISSSAFALAPAAGTVIKNQASATYTDSTGITQTTTSNLVETVIQQVGAFTLEQDQERFAIEGQVVSFPHVLTNTGNGNDNYTLGATDSVDVDDYQFTDFNIYPDVNQDGIADSNVPITETGVLASGEAFYFVVSATVPTGLADDDEGKITVTGTSTDSSLYTSPTELVTKTNTDTATVSDDAVIRVTKSISTQSGAAGSGPYTVTLTYSNPSTIDATDVTLSDILPAGMVYAVNSGEWSVTGAAALTDVVDAEADPGVTYCAYQAGCTDRVEAVIASVISGDSGTISFSINLEAGLSVSTLVNTAEFSYNNGTEVVPNQNTNSVPVDVISSPGVIANGSTASDVDLTGETVKQSSGAIGSTVSFDNIIWNTGNSVDTFDISIDEIGANFPTGTTFALYKSDGFTPLLDSDNSGQVDTGPIQPEDPAAAVPSHYYVVVLKARLPMSDSAAGVGPFTVTKTATSAIDPSISNPVTDELAEITGSEVDLTNNAAIGETGVLGVGAGPLNDGSGGARLTKVDVATGGSGVFKLYVNNTGGVADSFNLSYSKDSPFVEGTLPANWTVSFHADGGVGDCSTLGASINNTGVVSPGANRLICAKVSIASGAAFVNSEQSIYFQITSPLTGASDIKHDAVLMTASQKLILEPDNQAVTEPGSSVVYSHRLTNPGNTAYTNLTLSSLDTLAGEGWTTALYEDTNGDGILGAGDLPVGTYTLNPGDAMTIFAKVFAPGNAPFGASNQTDITATGNTNTGSVVVETVGAKDITTVALTNMKIEKRQAPDADCNGVADGGSYSFDMFPARPNTCVLYELKATNSSSSTAHNVRIDDLVPDYTSHFTAGSTLPVITAPGVITANPADGEMGMVGGSIPTVAAGASVTLVFGVRVE